MDLNEIDDINELYELFIKIVNKEVPFDATQRRIIDVVDKIIDWFGGMPE